MKLKLITEHSTEVELVEAKGSKDLYVVGVFSSAERKNANGRIYKKDTLDREVKRLHEDYFSKNLPLWGELGHPTTPDPNLDRVAIKTELLEWRGNDLYGKAKVLDTPMGNIAKTLLREGPIGISSRGLGKVDEDSYVNDSSYKLICWDVVGSPSNNPSYVKGIYEATEFVIAGVDEQEEKASTIDYFTQLSTFLDKIKLNEVDSSIYKDLVKIEDQLENAVAHIDKDPKTAKNWLVTAHSKLNFLINKKLK